MKRNRETKIQASYFFIYIISFPTLPMALLDYNYFMNTGARQFASILLLVSMYVISLMV